MVFAIMGAFVYFPFNTHVFDPISHGLKDFDVMDIVPSKLRPKNMPPHEKIVLVNAGYMNRSDLTGLVTKISAAQPAAIGLDVLFSGEKDSASDALLNEIIRSSPRLVAGSFLRNPDKNGVFNEIDTFPFVGERGLEYGFTNLVGEEQNTIRYFKPKANTQEGEHLSFPAAIAKAAAPQEFEKLMKRDKALEVIHYSRTHVQFNTLEAQDILKADFDPAELKGKIVLIGFLGHEAGLPVLEDLHFTPMNEAISGRSYPDMYGVAIHANVLAMILDETYINKVPKWLVLLLAFIICYVHVAFFTLYYVERHIWYHIVAKFVQLLSSFALVFIAVWLLARFNVKWNVGPALAAVVLSVDVLYFYDGLVKWLHKKFGYDTYYLHGHH